MFNTSRHKVYIGAILSSSNSQNYKEIKEIRAFSNYKSAHKFLCDSISKECECENEKGEIVDEWKYSSTVDSLTAFGNCSINKDNGDTFYWMLKETYIEE